MYVCVCVCVCVHMCAHVCMCCQGVQVLVEDKRQLQCHSLGSICLLFWGAPLTGTWNSPVSTLSGPWATEILSPPPQGRDREQTRTHTTNRSSSLHGKHFTRWAVSPGRADNTSIPKYTCDLTSGTHYHARQYRHQDTHPWWIINSRKQNNENLQTRKEPQSCLFLGFLSRSRQPTRLHVLPLHPCSVL